MLDCDNMDEVRTYRYSYLMEAQFAPAVGYQFFKVRALPMQQVNQQIIHHTLSLLPQCRPCAATDVWGNSVLYGTYALPHDHFMLHSEGMVSCRTYRIADLHPSPLYAAAGRLTQPDQPLRAAMQDWIEECCTSPDVIASLLHSPTDRMRLATSLMHFTHRRLTYRSHVTDCNTTASQALTQGQGVCQDFAHVMLVLCRLAGLTARYACGMVIGEGETHAWVEVHDGYAWLAFDPSRDRQVFWDYIKIAHGRDAFDCPLNRGQLYQCTHETFSASARVEEIPTPCPHPQSSPYLANSRN